MTDGAPVPTYRSPSHNSLAFKVFLPLPPPARPTSTLLPRASWVAMPLCGSSIMYSIPHGSRAGRRLEGSKIKSSYWDALHFTGYMLERALPMLTTIFAFSFCSATRRKSQRPEGSRVATHLPECSLANPGYFPFEQGHKP